MATWRSRRKPLTNSPSLRRPSWSASRRRKTRTATGKADRSGGVCARTPARAGRVWLGAIGLAPAQPGCCVTVKRCQRGGGYA
eukprot:5465556-Prymnesium_polylepis.1